MTETDISNILVNWDWSRYQQHNDCNKYTSNTDRLVLKQMSVLLTDWDWNMYVWHT